MSQTLINSTQIESVAYARVGRQYEEVKKRLKEGMNLFDTLNYDRLVYEKLDDDNKELHVNTFEIDTIKFLQREKILKEDIAKRMINNQVQTLVIF